MRTDAQYLWDIIDAVDAWAVFWRGRVWPNLSGMSDKEFPQFRAENS